MTGQHHLREFPGQRHPQDGSALLPAVHQLRDELQQHRPAREIRQRQAGVFPADRATGGATTITATRSTRPRCSTTRTARVGGVPNSYIVNDHDRIDVDEACEIKPTWNAAVCKGDVGRMNVGGGGGAVGFGGSAAVLVPVVPVPVPREARLPALRCRSRRAGARWSWRRCPRSRCCCTCCLCYCPRWWSNQRYPLHLQPPVVLSRNGKEFTANGETNVRAGTEIKVTTERPSVTLSVTELDAGSWVIFELPGFTTAASGTAQTAWMRCARPAPPRTTRATVRSGSRWSPPVTSLAAALVAALVAEPASRSAGKLQLLHEQEPPA